MKTWLWLVPSALAGGLVISVMPIAPKQFAAHELSASPLILATGCSYHCRDCGTQTEDKHDIVVHATTNEHEAQHLENCGPGSCDSHDCGMSFASLDGQGTKYTLDPKAAVGELVDLIEERPNLVTYNEARGSLQVYCDSGNLIANIPLSADKQAELELELELSQVSYR